MLCCQVGNAWFLCTVREFQLQLCTCTGRLTAILVYSNIILLLSFCPASAIEIKGDSGQHSVFSHETAVFDISTTCDFFLCSYLQQPAVFIKISLAWWNWFYKRLSVVAWYTQVDEHVTSKCSNPPKPVLMSSMFYIARYVCVCVSWSIREIYYYVFKWGKYLLFKLGKYLGNEQCVCVLCVCVCVCVCVFVCICVCVSVCVCVCVISSINQFE